MQVTMRLLLLERIATTAVFTLLYKTINTGCPVFRWVNFSQVTLACITACTLHRCVHPASLLAPCITACTLHHCLHPASLRAPCITACTLHHCLHPLAVFISSSFFLWLQSVTAVTAVLALCCQGVVRHMCARLCACIS